jgi:ubiquinone/menaquinone biosynthesis C-methylase UbiE
VAESGEFDRAAVLLVRASSGVARPAGFEEPYFSRFCQLLRSGAGSVDIHDADRPVAYASPSGASDAYLAHELGRVDMHRVSAGDLLASVIGPGPTVLDVGCGTGGCAVGLALSKLNPKGVTGVDLTEESIDAARQRALGYGLSNLKFQTIQRNAALPFADGDFDLVVSISVLEFISTPAARKTFLAGLKRVVRPGGYVYISTPNHVRLREFHSQRWFGNVRRQDGYPWSSSESAITREFAGFERVPLETALLRAHGLPSFPGAASIAAVALTWRKLLYRKPA